MKETFNGCIRWLQCGGKQSMVTPCSLALYTTAIFCVWVLWPLKTRKTGCFTDAEIHFKKWSNSFSNNEICTQSDWWQTTIEHSGVPVRNPFFFQTLGKTSIRGITEPSAFIQITAIHKAALSVDMRASACFLIFKAITFQGRPCSVGISVSSTLETLEGWNLYLF